MGACALASIAATTLIPLLIRGLINGPIRHHSPHSTSSIVALVLLILAFGLVDAGSMSLRRLTMAVAALGMETDLRNALYRHLQRLPVDFHDRWQSGQLLSRASSDLSTIRRFVGFGLVFLVANLVGYLLAAVILFVLYWPLALLVIVASLPIVEMSRRFERHYMVVSRRFQDQTGDLATKVEEAATGIRITKSFGRSRLLGRQFGQTAGLLRDTGMERAALLGRFWAMIEFVPNVTLALVLLGGTLAVSQGAMNIGDLVAFVAYVVSLAWPVDALGWIIAMAQEAETASTRIWEIFDITPAIANLPNARHIERATGLVRFEDVSFGYPGSSRPVLSGVNLELSPGETVALVGATGSGKTSLALLAPRLYDVTGGRITLDGHDIRHLELDSLRRQIGVAFEDPILFSASVRENVLLGWPDATDEDLAVALETARAEFAYDLPWGLDTRVGEQGLTLSGGQRQRLALARAIVGRPQVLVLDDPLSALDVGTEAEVEEALARVLKGVTALVVAHRPSTVDLADRVAFLHEGKIAASGSHHQLLREHAGYRAILSQEAEHEGAA